MPAAVRLWWRGQAWVEHAGLPASGSWGAAVSVGLAVGVWAGEGAGRFAGVWGRCADPGWLGDRWPFAWSACRLCCLGSCSGGAPWHADGAGLWMGRCATGWLFCWLLCSGTIFEKLNLPVGTAGFEPAAPWPPVTFRASLGVARCRSVGT